MTADTGARPRRWIAQRWALDNIIKANTLDWDQPRSMYWSAPCGSAAGADFTTVRGEIQKIDDFSVAFEAQAKRREILADRALAEGRLVEAREHFFVASIHWGAAQWPVYAADAHNLELNARKRRCYSQYATLADHRVEAVEIALGDKMLRGWLHFPINPPPRAPVIVSFPGMDSFKEASVSLYGDYLLNRGYAVLAVEGPGQYEAPLDGVFLNLDDWISTGPACVDHLVARADIDPDRIGLAGRSFGSFGATLAATAEPRFRAIAISATCFQPGFERLCEEASTTFKARLMFMSNFVDEDRFDAFRRTLNWKGRVSDIKSPYLCIGGEFDELTPMVDVEALMADLSCVRRLVIYAKSKHSVGFETSSAELGPSVNTLTADWFDDCFSGKIPRTQRWFVDSDGDVAVSPL